MNKVCSLLSTGKEKRNDDSKSIPLAPMQKHKKKVAALLMKPTQKERSSTERLRQA